MHETLPCGHCSESMVDDHCGKPEHRYCLTCHEGECNANWEKVCENLTAENVALKQMKKQGQGFLNELTEVRRENAKLRDALEKAEAIVARCCDCLNRSEEWQEFKKAFGLS